MKYRHLNEISKYFKPVDYIEELTPEEEEERDLQNYYAENMDKLKNFAERFTSGRDSIVLTFYRTLYQTAGDNLQLEFKNNNITPDNIYSVVLTAVLEFMHKMTSDETYYYVEKQEDYNLNEYIGISASVVIRDNDSENEKIPDTLTLVYIPDIQKYKDLICSANINGKEINLTGVSYGEGYKIKNIISNNIDIPMYLVIDNIDMLEWYMEFFSQCLVKLMSAEAYYKFKSDKNVMTPVKALEYLMEVLEHTDHTCWRYTHMELTKSDVIRLCKSVKNREAYNILSDYINDDIMFNVLLGIVDLKYRYNIDIRDFKYLLHSASTKRDFETALKNSIDNIADTYKEYLDKHSSAIKKQLNMFSDAVANALHINSNNITMSCTFLVPDTRVSSFRDRKRSDAVVLKAYGYSAGLIVK